MRAGVVVVILVAAGACRSVQVVPPSVSASAAGPRALPSALPPPGSSAQAQAYLAGAVAALHSGQAADAALFLDAILRSDHLTDRGRSNVYWLAADAHRLAGDEAGLVDALGGFLVSAEVASPDDETLGREVEARSQLLARKVRAHPLLGKSPSSPITVVDARDPAGLAAELGCVEDAVASTDDGNKRLEQRRLICRETGEKLVLWFDVTGAR